MSRTIAAALGSLVLLATLAIPAPAHEGHDHGPQQTVKADALPRGHASSDLFELVAVGHGGDLAIYIDRLATNEPLQDATVEVETPDGPASAIAADGTYRLKAPWLMKPGRKDFIVTVTAGSETDVLPVSIDIPEPSSTTAQPQGPLARALALLGPSTGIGAGFGFMAGVALMALRRRPNRAAAVLWIAVLLASGSVSAHDGHDHGAAPAVQSVGDRASRAADGSVFVPKPIQRIFGLRTVRAETAVHPRIVELPGRIIPDPNASGFVQTAVGGRLSPPPGGFPRLGSRVRQGDVLAHVTPPMQQIDVSDMRQRQHELDQQISIVERRMLRYEKLAPSGAIAQIQLEETKLELEGLRERRAAIDRVRREPEVLVAPVSGVIADGTPISGQIAQPNAVVFHIVDPARLWIEALSFEAVTQPRDAVATVGGSRTLPLTFRGSGWTDRSQSVAVQFQIDGEVAGLRAGQFVSVFVSTDEQRTGIAVPKASVIRTSNGQDVVYLHTAPEVFEARPVRIEPLDGERVLVLAGIERGARVATRGADLVDHVR